MGRRNLLGGIGLALAVAGISSVAAAEEGSKPSVSLFSPVEAGSDWFTADSLDFRSSRHMAVRFTGDYAYKPLVVYGSDGAEVGSLVEHQVVGNLGVSSVFFDRVRVAANVPASLFSAGESFSGGSVDYSAPVSIALGDVRASVAARLFGRYGDPFTFAVGTRAQLPTGWRDAYIDQDVFQFDGHALFAGTVKDFMYAGRFGYNFDKFDVKSGIVDANLALGASLLQGDLFLGPEAKYATPIDSVSIFSPSAALAEVMLGSHYKFTPSWKVGLGGGVGFLGSLGTPRARGMMTVEWVWNKPVPLPPPPPPFSPVVEEPPPPAPVVAVPEPPKVVDSDGDGVPDSEDTCPGVAGAVAAGVKSKGCPVKIVVDEKTVIDSIDFEKNGNAVKQSSSAALDQVLQTLKSLPPNSKFRVEGHTDNKGNKKKSVALSKTRAEAVVKWFVDKGFPADKFSAEGMGQERPVESNKTKKGRAKNRRVEVYIIEESAAPAAPGGTEKK